MESNCYHFESKTKKSRMLFWFALADANTFCLSLNLSIDFKNKDARDRIKLYKSGIQFRICTNDIGLILLFLRITT